MEYWEITVQTAPEGIEQIAAALTAGGFDSLVLEDQDQFQEFLEENRDYWDYIDEKLAQQLQGLSRIKLYLELDGTEEARLQKLKRILEVTKTRLPEKKTGSLELTVTHLAETNWEESWKDNYPPQEVGRSLIVLPCWNREETRGRIPVILDPGLTFGSGAHPSTRMCMEFLEEQLRPGSRVLDLGSGSGILSIAALRLGAAHATGVDVDPKAEKAAMENADWNGYDRSRFTPCTGNVTADEALMSRLEGEGYDAVLVNIVADVILALAPVLRRFLKPDGRVICSGILDVREAEVIAALEENGLKVLEQKAQEDWRALLLAAK